MYHAGCSTEGSGEMVVGLCAPTCDSSDSGLSGELVGRCGVVAFDDGAVVVFAAAAEEISRPAAEIDCNGPASNKPSTLLLPTRDL